MGRKKTTRMPKGLGTRYESKTERGRYVRRFKLPDGTPCMRSSRVSWDDLDEKVAEAIREHENPYDGQMTVGKWLEHWLTDVLPNDSKVKSKSTREKYEIQVRCHIVPELGRKRLSALSPRDVDAMVTSLRGKGLSLGTVRIARVVLGKACAVAVREGRGLMPHGNPVTSSTRLERPAPLRDEMSADESAALLSAAAEGGDPYSEALAALEMHTGLRNFEIRALTWADIDLDEGTVSVRVSKTEAGVRQLPLTPPTVSALRRWRLASKWSDDAHAVFSVRGGAPPSAHTIRDRWTLVTRAAGLGDRRFHAARHTSATLMLNAGVPLEVVSKFHGHANLGITADTYATVGAGLQRQAATALAAALESAQSASGAS